MRQLSRSLLLITILLFIPYPAQAEELIKVTLLGTGSPRPSPDRNGPSTLIEAGGQRLLFDMGRVTPSPCTGWGYRSAALMLTSSPTCTLTTLTACPICT